MNRTHKIIPVYTGDVSGVCSALYELGGMVVIHDPSGCNSTYNTHDEVRWYDMDSMIYITGFTETEAVLGADDALIRSTEEAAEELRPRFIALISSPIPYMTGTDFEAIARTIERDSGIPSFYIGANGMHDYVCGAGMALEQYCRRFVHRPDRRVPGSVNILGATPLDHVASGEIDGIREALVRHGFTVCSVWSMGDPPEQLARAGSAAVDLVISAAGMPVARQLYERFGIPWVAGVPVGAFAPVLMEALERAEALGMPETACRIRTGSSSEGALTLIGEPVTMGSLASAAVLETGISARVLCPLERCAGLLAPQDSFAVGEEEAEQLLAGARLVAADPLYRPVLPREAKLLRVPHLAFSGRCFQKQALRLSTLDVGRWLEGGGEDI